MTSPVQDFEPFEDEGALLGDSQENLQEEEDGEELFGDNMEKYVLYTCTVLYGSVTTITCLL